MRQRGVALITAIVLVAIATVLAVHIGTRAALDLRRTAGLMALDQGWHVALGAEAWAAEVLRDDLEDSGTTPTDHLGEAWAQPLPPLPVDGGEVRGALEDMQGRFNINNLVTSDRQVNETAVAQFERLLLLVGAQTRWARIMVDWIDDGTVPEIPEGAEDGTYLSQNPPYRTANVVVSTTTEMMALPGMTREEFERIRPYVAALPVGTTINLCTAKAPGARRAHRRVARISATRSCSSQTAGTAATRRRTSSLTRSMQPVGRHLRNQLPKLPTGSALRRPCVLAPRKSRCTV